MKKVYFGLFLLVLSIMLTTFSYNQVSAESVSNTIEIETIYPENVLDYTNLSDISAFDINDKYIVYTRNKTDVILFEKETRNYKTISEFNEIYKIKFASNYIIVADSENIKVIKNFNENPQIYKINEISVLNSKAIDIYVNENYIYIALVDSTSFKLYKYNLDLTFETNNPVLTVTPFTNVFNQAFMVAINDKSAYVVYKTSSGDKYTTGLCVLDFNKDYNSENIDTIDTFWTNARVIDTFWFENHEFIVTFTNEILYLLSPSNQKYASINISTQGDLETNTFPIFEITDISFYNNLVYVSDSTYKTIQTFEITPNESGYNLQSKEIILCGNSFDRGRFDGVKDIFVQGQNIYVSDTLNNRIQILKNNHSEFINVPSANTNPHSINLDSNQNLYFVETESTQSKIVKYKFENNTYSLDNKFFKVNSVNIGNISDICIAKSNSVFAIDSDYDKIYYLSENNLEELTNTSLAIDFTSTSKIEYIKKSNKFIVSSGNSLYYLNNEGELLHTLNIANLKEITSDFDSIYAITSDKIYIIKCLENSLEIGDFKSFDSSNYSSFTFEILSRKMIAFDNDRSCLVKFDCELSRPLFTLSDITKSQALQTTSTILPLKLTNNFIYDYPYELGNVYEMNSENNNCIGIEEYNDYYRVLFKSGNSLKSGYIRKSNTQKIDYIYNPISVITTNHLVPVYKYPTLLKYEEQRLVVKNLEINTPITLLYNYPVSLDGKEFYLYQFGDNIGFIFNADVVLNENKTIKNLNSENASIRLIGKESTLLLNEDKQTKVLALKDKDRIFVENYDKNEKYTKVIIKDKDLNTIEGYVLTEDIQMDKLDNSKIILIIIIIASVLILTLIIISYFVIKKKNK